MSKDRNIDKALKVVRWHLVGLRYNVQKGKAIRNDIERKYFPVVEVDEDYCTKNGIESVGMAKPLQDVKNRESFGAAKDFKEEIEAKYTNEVSAGEMSGFLSNVFKMVEVNLHGTADAAKQTAAANAQDELARREKIERENRLAKAEKEGIQREAEARKQAAETDKAQAASDKIEKEAKAKAEKEEIERGLASQIKAEKAEAAKDAAEDKAQADQKAKDAAIAKLNKTATKPEKI